MRACAPCMYAHLQVTDVTYLPLLTLLLSCLPAANASLHCFLCAAAVAVGIAAGAAARLLQQATLEQKVRL